MVKRRFQFVNTADIEGGIPLYQIYYPDTGKITYAAYKYKDDRGYGSRGYTLDESFESESRAEVVEWREAQR